MTTGIQCRADPRCKVPAPAKTGICHCHAQQAKKTRAIVRGPSVAERVRPAWSREPEKGTGAMTEITIHPRAGIVARISAWLRRRQRDLSDRVHAAADERARRYGWEVIESTGRFGFGARTYRDPRFDARQRQLSHGAAQATGRDHSEASLGINRPACDPDAAPYLSPEKKAILAERPGALPAETEPTEDQIIGWNEANDYWNEAVNYEPGEEAGE